MSRRVLVAGAVLLVLAGLAVAGGVALLGDDGAAAVTETPGEVTARPEPGAGPTPLDVSVFTPDGEVPGADPEGRRPAVLVGHGFGGSKDDVAGLARGFAEAGYVAMTWSARGFGSSGGLVHLSSADWEIADVSLLVDELAERDDVLLDAAGDPVVGVVGASYGGAAALLAAAYDDRVDAVVPAVTWHDLEGALFEQNAESVPSGGTGPGVFKQRWAALLYGSALAQSGSAGSTGSAEPSVCGRFAPEVCRLYQAAARGEPPSPAAGRLLARSSATPAALRDYRAPTLLLQGTEDSLFGLEEATATARELREGDVEVAMRWVEGGHDAGGLGAAGPSDLLDPALDWFDVHLRGQEPAEEAFTTSLPPPPLRSSEVETRSADLDEVLDPPTTEVSLSGEAQPVVSPPGGQPAALTSLPGAGAALGLAGQTGGGYALAVLPGGSAVFDSAPLADPVTVVGSPEVELSVTGLGGGEPGATLFASLWLVAEDETAILPRQLVAPFAVVGDDLVTVTLPSAAYRVEPGQRLRLVVSTTDQAYAVPADARAQAIALSTGTLRLPTPPTRAVASGATLVPTPLLVGVGALLLLALVAALAALGRSRGLLGSDPDPDLAEVPLAVRGLVKAYPGGARAVDEVTWEARRGQVVGLLGPNGAGKTTTMRMLVGLIAPDAGEVHVLGRPVGPGSPVLADVGALIEGPGSLPHLTGRENLRAHWAATGRPEAEASYDEVLAVAALGDAIDAPVRSYSHGMRQRLGIAQAMLGTPDLLLLDEPTNGLDPPQIRALREVLRRYAETGRTVVVSSHLLGEVEQTCSHVVVMHRGRVVMTGAVADLLAAAEVEVVLDGGDPREAARLLTGLVGVTAAEPVGDGRVRVAGTARHARLVEILVREGYGVAGIEQRRRLEEVFMGLVGEEVAP